MIRRGENDFRTNDKSLIGRWSSCGASSRGSIKSGPDVDKTPAGQARSPSIDLIFRGHRIRRIESPGAGESMSPPRGAATSTYLAFRAGITPFADAFIGLPTCHGADAGIALGNSTEIGLTFTV